MDHFAGLDVSSRPRTDRVIVMEIPVRMRQTRTATETEESQSGLFCQAKTTRCAPARKLALVFPGERGSPCPSPMTPRQNWQSAFFVK